MSSNLLIMTVEYQLGVPARQPGVTGGSSCAITCQFCALPRYLEKVPPITAVPLKQFSFSASHAGWFGWNIRVRV